MKLPDSLRKLARDMSALGEIADYLDRVGSLENAEQEAKQRLMQVQQDEKTAQGQLAAVSETVHRRQEEAREAQDFAAKVEASAKERASEIEAAARAKAQGIIVNAEMSARATGALVVEARKELNELGKQVEAKQAELIRVEKAIADTRRKIAAI